MYQFPPHIQAVLTERRVSPERQAQLTPEEAFQEYCEWHGLIHWHKDLWETVLALSALVPTEPFQRSPHKSKLCMTNLKAEIESWLRAGWTRNNWFERDRISVYLRRSQRHLNAAPRKVLDVASITSRDEGKGRCRAFFQMIEDLPFDGIYVENVQNPLLVRALIRWEYQVDPRSKGQPAPSFFKLKESK